MTGRLYAIVMLASMSCWALVNPIQMLGQEVGPVHTEMRNVTYHFAPAVSVKIVSLSGSLVPTKEGRWPVFDEPASFNIHVDTSRILVPPADLAAVLNKYVFSAKDAPLRDVSAAVEKGQLKIKGKLHSKGDIAFELLATVSANPDGRVRMHTDKVKALHVPVKGLMDLFGIEIDDLIKNGKVPGLEAEKDDLLLNLDDVLPAPKIQGPVKDIHIEGGFLVLLLGKWERTSGSEKGRTSPENGNYMAFKGNHLQFGKLLMSDTDLTILDLDANDPLDFFLERYKDQLVPGYTKITPGFGLRSYMKDFNKLQSKGQATAHSQ